MSHCSAWKQLYRLKTDHFLALFCFYSAPVPIIVACYLYMPQWVHTNLAMVPDFSKRSPVSSHLAEAMGQKTPAGGWKCPPDRVVGGGAL